MRAEASLGGSLIVSSVLDIGSSDVDIAFTVAAVLFLF